ncbi:hypothetical protein D3C71_2243010 [compost metagenome]
MEICAKLENLDYIFNFNIQDYSNIDNNIYDIFDKKIKELKSTTLKKYVSNDDYLKILEKEI